MQKAHDEGVASEWGEAIPFEQEPTGPDYDALVAEDEVNQSNLAAMQKAYDNAKAREHEEAELEKIEAELKIQQEKTIRSSSRLAAKPRVNTVGQAGPEKRDKKRDQAMKSVSKGASVGGGGPGRTQAATTTSRIPKDKEAAGEPVLEEISVAVPSAVPGSTAMIPLEDESDEGTEEEDETGEFKKRGVGEVGLTYDEHSPEGQKIQYLLQSFMDDLATKDRDVAVEQASVGHDRLRVKADYLEVKLPPKITAESDMEQVKEYLRQMQQGVMKMEQLEKMTTGQKRTRIKK